MATLLPPGKQQFLDMNGAPLAGGFVSFYVPGTTTFKDTYQDAPGAVLNTNPVILDAAGEAVIYGVGAYRQVVKDQFGNVVWDQVTSDTAATSSSWAAQSTLGGGVNSQVVNAPNFSSVDGQSIDFVAIASNTGPFSLNPNGLGAINVKLDSVTGPRNLVGGEVVLGNSYRVTYGALVGFFHLSFIMDKSYIDTRDSIIGNNAQTAANTAQANAISAAAADAQVRATAAQNAAQSFATNADTTVTNNAATDAQARATAAQNAAQAFATNADTTVTNNAATDATTKANNAQSTAISTASTDATTKSNNAQTAAQNYSLVRFSSAIRLSGEFTQAASAARVVGTVLVNSNGTTSTLRYVQLFINGAWVNATDA